MKSNVQSQSVSPEISRFLVVSAIGCYPETTEATGV